MPKLKIVSWIAQIAAVAIMGQTLFFKFTGHPESVQIFTELGIEPHGRLLIGALELCACLLLLFPIGIVYGALLGCGLMAGAIVGHVTELGWEGPRGELGTLAIVTLACCLITLMIRYREIPFLTRLLQKKPAA